jgi:preprotein translocase subunit YajC
MFMRVLAVTAVVVLGLSVCAVAQDTQRVPLAPEGDGGAGAGAPAGTAAAPTTGEQAPPAGNSKGGGDMTFLIILIVAFIAFYFWMGRSNRKREQQRKTMLAALKKGDKITTIGGVRGTVVEVREDEVMVKVDENVRMRFSRWAIRDVGEEKPEEKKS